MKRFLVGGAVRDALLGLPVKEKDWVVVGATPQQMIDAGYKAVGKDFPVFLHPETKEEHALARTERKSGHGYRGFTFHTGPDVTLEQDLRRRDLTVNAMAQAEDGTLIDPYGGRRDLDARRLRHVSAAFVEDPVRVLRVARLHARFAPLGFRVADGTLALMRELVASGEADHLVPERVWQETARALTGPNLSPLPSEEGAGGGGVLGTQYRPSIFFGTLRDCGALARIMPELDALFGVPQPAEYHPEIDSGLHTLMCVDAAAAMAAPLEVRVAALLHDLGKAATPREEWPKHVMHEVRGVPLVQKFCERLRVPSACRDLAVTVTCEHLLVHRAPELRPGSLLELLERLHAFRDPPRFAQALDACACDARGRAGRENDDFAPGAYLREAAQIAAAVQAREVVAAGFSGCAIGEELRRRRVEALAAWKRDRAD